MLNRGVEGTRKFRKAETPNLARTRAEWISGDLALPSQAEQVTGSNAEELSGTLGINEWLEGRHPYSILRIAIKSCKLNTNGEWQSHYTQDPINECNRDISPVIAILDRDLVRR